MLNRVFIDYKLLKYRINKILKKVTALHFCKTELSSAVGKRYPTVHGRFKRLKKKKLNMISKKISKIKRTRIQPTKCVALEPLFIVAIVHNCDSCLEIEAGNRDDE